jgi:hypothetical protein
VFSANRVAAAGNSKLPGTVLTKILDSLAPCFFKVIKAPSSKAPVISSFHSATAWYQDCKRKGFLKRLTMEIMNYKL